MAPPKPKGPSLAKRASDLVLVYANKAEALVLRGLSPIGKPVVTAAPVERTLINSFAIYSVLLGLGATYYAVFVRPTKFNAPVIPPFSLSSGHLPHAEAAGGGHGAAAESKGGEHGAAKDDGHGGGDAKKAKPKAKGKTPPKKKAAAKADEHGGGH